MNQTNQNESIDLLQLSIVDLDLLAESKGEKYAQTDLPGVYNCKHCHRQLFSSTQKLKDQTFPSFKSPISNYLIKTVQNSNYGISRSEIMCEGCGLHLGYVYFEDENKKEKQYRVLSLCLDFEENQDMETPLDGLHKESIGSNIVKYSLLGAATLPLLLGLIFKLKHK